MPAPPGGGNPEPKAQPPAPPLLPDPRLVLGIAYAVRADLVAHARVLAELTKGIDHPEAYAEHVKERRARQVQEAQHRRRLHPRRSH